MQFQCAVCQKVVHLGAEHAVRFTSAGRQFIHCECKSSQDRVVQPAPSENFKASCTTQTKSIGHN